jgi:putative redox protein
VFTVTNIRGGQPRFGTGSDTSFTPAELLLGAIAGCAAIDVDILASRRAEPDRFQVGAGADKVRDADGNRLTGIVVTFQIGFPGGADGDEPGRSCRIRSPHRMTGCAPSVAP